MAQNEKLIAYVKQEMKSGKKKEDVISELRKVRWDDKAISSIFEEIDKESKVQDEREKDTFSNDEFQKLEEKEKNKSITSILKKDEKSQDKEKSKSSDQDMSLKDLSREYLKLKDKMEEIFANVEKEEGKFEFEEDIIKNINERIADLSQQIGEVRQTIVNRERYFNKMETEFEKMKEDIQNINPSSIIKEFEKRDLEINKLTAKTEKTEEKNMELQETLSRFVGIMSKISNFETIILTLKDVKSDVEKVNLQKEHIDALVEKAEMLFKELAQSSQQISEFDMKISDFRSTLKQFKSELSKMNSTFESYPKKEIIQKIEKNVNTIMDLMFEKDKKKFQ